MKMPFLKCNALLLHCKVVLIETSTNVLYKELNFSLQNYLKHSETIFRENALLKKLIPDHIYVHTFYFLFSISTAVWKIHTEIYYHVLLAEIS